MKFILALLISAALAAQAFAADLSQPVVADSRVKTFVYNDNEVYPILTQYGYQTNIEFGKSEEIQTISVGDRVAWQIIPAGRRLFIQTLQDNVQTNLTVVTDRRAYQFDLRSVGASAGHEDEIVYVARFYYPEDGWDDPAPAAVSDQLLVTTSDQYNFNYTFSGPDNLAPTKVFDDGRSTFFQFRGAAPQIYAVGADGLERPVTARPENGYLVVSSTASQFAARQGQQVICIFNEKAHRR